MKFAAFLAVVVLSLSACTGGFEGTIGASDGKKGRQNKKVTIVANTHPSTNMVVITGEVVAPN